MRVSIKSVMIAARICPVNIEEVLKRHSECYYDKSNSPSVFFDYGRAVSVAVSSTGVLISNGAATVDGGTDSIYKTVKKLKESGISDGVIRKDPCVSGITCIINATDSSCCIDLKKVLKNNSHARTNRAFHSVVLKLSGGQTAQIYKNGTVVCVAIKSVDSIAACVAELKRVTDSCVVPTDAPCGKEKGSVQV